METITESGVICFRRIQMVNGNKLFEFRSLLPPLKELLRIRAVIVVVWSSKTLNPYFMYHRFTVYKDNASSHWILTVYDRIGRYIHRRLWIIQADFEATYKRRKAISQVDTLSHLTFMSETIANDDSHEILVLLVDETKTAF